jgi:hypothetical protein
MPTCSEVLRLENQGQGYHVPHGLAPLQLAKLEVDSQGEPLTSLPGPQ